MGEEELMTTRTRVAASLLAASLSLPSAAPAQPHGPPTSSPNGAPDGARDFDFEIGNWKTHVARLRHPLSGDTVWLEYDGTSVVKPVWGGRANTVELEVEGPGGRHIQGLSLRLYNPQSRQWSINYVNAASGTMGVPTVGAFTNGRGEFFDWEAYDGRMILVRNVWKDITPTSCRFEQSYSDDGGRTWELNWVATDTRLRDAPPPPPDTGSHDFDFEIGAWTVHNRRLLDPLTDSARWIDFEGTSVARPVWNGRAVLVELASDSPSGHSEGLKGLILRTYDPQARQWNVAFASSAGGVLSPPQIGAFARGRGEFYALERLADGRTVLARSVLSDITPTSYRLAMAYSADGGRTWQVTWTSAHTRARR
jgi:hypothetical protein